MLNEGARRDIPSVPHPETVKREKEQEITDEVLRQLNVEDLKMSYERAAKALKEATLEDDTAARIEYRKALSQIKDQLTALTAEAEAVFFGEKSSILEELEKQIGNPEDISDEERDAFNEKLDKIIELQTGDDKGEMAA